MARLGRAQAFKPIIVRGMVGASPPPMPSGPVQLGFSNQATNTGSPQSLGNFFGVNNGTAGNGQTTVETKAQFLCRTPGTFSKLTASWNGSGTTRTANFRKNGANGNEALSTSSGSAVITTDSVNTDAVTTGDLLCLEVASTTVAGLLYWTAIVFTASSNWAVFHYQGHGGASNPPTTTPMYVPIQGDMLSAVLTEAAAQARFRGACSLANAQIIIQANTRSTTTTINSRKNGATGNISLSFAAGVTGTIEDTAHSDSISSGDLWCWQINQPSGTGSLSLNHLMIAAQCSDSLYDIFSHTLNSATLGNAANCYCSPFGGSFINSGATTPIQQVIVPSLAWSNMRVNIVTNTASGSNVIQSWHNGASGNQSITIGAGATGWFEDTSNSDAMVSGDTFALKCTTWSTGVALNAIGNSFRAGNSHTQSAMAGVSLSSSRVLNTGRALLSSGGSASASLLRGNGYSFTSAISASAAVVRASDALFSSAISVVASVARAITLPSVVINVAQSTIRQLTTHIPFMGTGASSTLLSRAIGATIASGISVTVLLSRKTAAFFASSISAIASIVHGAGHFVTATASAAQSTIRQLTSKIPLLGTAASSNLLGRVFGVPLLNSVSQVSSAIFSLSRAFASLISATALLSKGKLLALASSISATALRGLTTLLPLTASSSQNTILVRKVSVPLLASASQIASLLGTIGRIFLSSITATALLSKGKLEAVLASAASSALRAIKTTKAFSSSISIPALIQRGKLQALASSIGVTASSTAGRVVPALTSAAAAASLVRQVGVTLLSNIAASAFRAASRIAYSVLSAISVVAAATTRSSAPAINASIVVDAQMQRGAPAVFMVPVYVAAREVRVITRKIAISVSAFSVLSKRFAHRFLAAASTTNITVHRITVAFLSAVSSPASLVRQVRVILSAQVQQSIKMARAIRHSLVGNAQAFGQLNRRAGRKLLASAAGSALVHRLTRVILLASAAQAASRRVAVVFVTKANGAAQASITTIRRYARSITGSWGARAQISRKTSISRSMAVSMHAGLVFRQAKTFLANAANSSSVKRLARRALATIGSSTALLHKKTGRRFEAGGFQSSKVKLTHGKAALAQAQALASVPRPSRLIPLRANAAVTALLTPLRAVFALASAAASSTFAFVKRLISHPMLKGRGGQPTLKGRDNQPNLKGKIE